MHWRRQVVSARSGFGIVFPDELLLRLCRLLELDPAAVGTIVKSVLGWFPGDHVAARASSLTIVKSVLGWFPGDHVVTKASSLSAAFPFDGGEEDRISTLPDDLLRNVVAIGTTSIFTEVSFAV